MTVAGSSTSAGFALHCRGDVRLYFGDSDCTPRSKKGRALLAILAAEQRPLSRVKIIDLLWSDRQEEQARASLRTLLSDLKEQFNSGFDDLLVVERERIALGPSVRSDLTDPTLARPAGELFEGLDHIDPELDEWLRMERERWRNVRRQTAPPAAQLDPAATRSSGRRAPVWRLLATLALLVIAAAAAALLVLQPWKTADQAVVAVLEFRDLTGRNALLADGLAEQMRIELAQYPGVGVISAQSSEADEIKGKDARAMAAALGADHLLEGTLVPHDGAVQLSLRLTDRSNGKVSWSTVVGGSPTTALSGPRPVVPMIAEVLSDVASKAAPVETLQADSAAWSALFQARSILNYEPGPARQARDLMLDVLDRHPKFVPAIITLTHATLDLADSAYDAGQLTRPQARAAAIKLARQAVALAPDYGPAYSVMGAALDFTDAAAAYEKRAVELSPGSGAHHHNWATELARIGDYEAAFRHRRIALRLNPLSWQAHLWFGEDLATVGRYAEARDIIQLYLARPVPRQRKLQLAANAEGDWLGNWSRGLMFGQAALREEPDDGWSRSLVMWPALRLYGPQAAAGYAPEGLMRDILNDDLDGVLRAVRTLDKELWTGGVNVNAAIHYLHGRGRGDLPVELYDRALASGLSPDAPEFLLPELVPVLRGAGRRRDSDELAQRLARRTRTDRSVAPRQRLLRLAVDHALAGRTDAALEALGSAQRHRWWASVGIADHPFNLRVFDALRADPRFHALARDYDSWVERERAEAAQELKAAGLQPFAPTPPPRARLS